MAASGSQFRVVLRIILVFPQLIIDMVFRVNISSSLYFTATIYFIYKLLKYLLYIYIYIYIFFFI